MKTKWFKYPKQTPHETGFYTVRGIREEAIANHDDRALKQLVSDLKYRQAINYKNVRWHLKTGRAPLVTSEDKSKFQDVEEQYRILEEILRRLGGICNFRRFIYRKDSECDTCLFCSLEHDIPCLLKIAIALKDDFEKTLNETVGPGEF